MTKWSDNMTTAERCITRLLCLAGGIAVVMIVIQATAVWGG